MSEQNASSQQEFKLSRRQLLQEGLAVGAVIAGTGLPLPGSDDSNPSSAGNKPLFPTNLSSGEWLEFPAEGFSGSVVGVIHRREYPAQCGVPLGGIGTGFL